jgi:hypothetical protein
MLLQSIGRREHIGTCRCKSISQTEEETSLKLEVEQTLVKFCSIRELHFPFSISALHRTLIRVPNSGWDGVAQPRIEINHFLHVFS